MGFAGGHSEPGAARGSVPPSSLHPWTKGAATSRLHPSPLQQNQELQNPLHMEYGGDPAPHAQLPVETAKSGDTS